ncbi:hypothetical protein F0U62_20960 [Cystobacter fuscus]|uniref:P-loop NTPase fold protein n=1 Tax=Cystobacter fuscus TaxID=43 RepID=UPI002B2BEABC|nr:hypothetical protein F0U62_20960 [Cystobacter fuscus]
MNRRAEAVLGRWLEVFALGLAGGAIFALLLPILPSCQAINSTLAWAFVPSLLLAGIVCYSFARDRVMGWSGLRHLIDYPPPWVAALIGFLLLLVYICVYPATMQKPGCAPIELETMRAMLPKICIGFLGCSLIAWRLSNSFGARGDRAWISRSIKSDKRPPSDKKTTTSILAEDFEELKKWIMDDQPVNHPNLDAFGRYAIAQRLAAVLGSPGDSHQTIALVGEPGVGKSTILSLTIYQMVQNKQLGSRVTIIPVSLWPFDSVEAAVRGILAPLSDGLSRHVNVSPIAGLPDEYVNAIENTGQNWARLLKSPKSPSAVLASYDRIATAIGLRVVLWIEDIERFAGVAVVMNNPEIERLEPIRSLLNLLSDFKSLRIVLASAALSTRFDIEKFARIVEPVPPPDALSIWKILKCFRENHLTLAKDVIDPAPPEIRKHLDELGNWTEFSVVKMFGGMSPALALARLCDNPRRLKYCLRHCQDAWIRLKGEVDFDDIFLISALRAAEPNVFSLVNQFIDELRSSHTSKEGMSDALSVFSMELEKLMGKGVGQRQAAIEAVLDFVFPGWKNPKKEQPRHHKPQGLAVNSHRDYWVRYLSSSLVSDDEKDQRVLQAIFSWKEKRSDELIQMLVKEDQNSAIAEFSQSCLVREDVLRLLAETTRAEMARPPEALRARFKN